MPRAGTPVIHPDMMRDVAGLSGFTNDVVTIKEKGTTRNTFGEGTDALGPDVYTNVRCRMSMNSRGEGDAERELQLGIATVHTYNFILDGYYPNVSEKHVAVYDGLVLDIEDVKHASGKAFTQLGCEKVR